ncbi:hypothetical protein ACQUFW_01725 [Acinetobacter johnsonii]|uniref:hypothetical protein n=1 Tax=Acinetobacter johnsonii TaxID=40214 RepID=UPI003D17186B
MMKVYEMIFSMGLEEQERMVYLKNTRESREDFVCRMKDCVNREWESFNDFQGDVNVSIFLKEIYDEILFNIESLKYKFIDEGKAYKNAFIFFEIEEKNVIIH